MFRPAEPADRSALIALADATGIFRPGEAEGLLGGVLDELQAGRLGEGQRAVVWVDRENEPPAGWVYFGPAPMAEGVWDLWWIGVEASRQGQGIGSELLRFVESEVLSAQGRLLLIETSSLPSLEPTRRFYESRGYSLCGQIPDYYAFGDDKITYAKRLVTGGHSPNGF